jgi:hypothetical protein
MNGVSPTSAVCVLTPLFIPPQTGGYWLLYTAASCASSGWFYLTNYLNATAGASTGPVVTASQRSQYVVVSPTPGGDPSIGWLTLCHPDMSKLTLL